MPNFDFRAYFEFAEDLLGAFGSGTPLFRSQEAVFRTIIGRAYYAAVQAVAEKLRSRGVLINEQKGQFHSSVRFHSQKLHAKLSDRLNGLRQRREGCDYGNSISFTETHAREAVEDARYIFNVLDSMKH